MKILRLRLVNFKGIEKGMGLRDLELDLSKCDKRIILLLGGNGKGKTVIQSCMTPFRETFDNRERDLIIDGEVGIKEIDIYSDDHIYKIEHIYSDKANKSFITKYKIDDLDNGEVLNKSGILKGFNDACYKEFGITPDFIRLVKLGSRTTSLIDLNSSDRKKFIGNYIPSVTDYLSAYKNATSEYNNLNRDIKHIISELDKLGDAEEINKELRFIKTQLSNSQDLLSSASVKLKEKIEILGNVESFQSEFKKLNEYRTALNTMISNLIDSLENLDSKYKNAFSKAGDTPAKIKKSLLNKIITNLENYNEELKELEIFIASHEAKIISVKNDIQNNNSTISKIKDTLDGLDLSETLRIEEAIKNTKTVEIPKYTKIINDNPRIYSFINNKELSECRIICNDVKHTLSDIYDVANCSIIKDSEMYDHDKSLSENKSILEKELKTLEKQNKVDEGELDKLSNSLTKYNSDFVEYKTVYKHLDECVCGDECKLVDHIKANANLKYREDKINSITNEINVLTKNIKSVNIEIESIESILEEIDKMEKMNDHPLDLIEFINTCTDIDIDPSEVSSSFDMMMWITPSIYEKVNLTLKNAINVFKAAEKVSSLENDLMRFNEQLRILKSTNEKIEVYNKLNDDLQIKLNELNSNEKYTDSVNALNELKDKIRKVNISKSMTEEYIEKLGKLQEHEKELLSVNKDIRPIEEKLNNLSSDIAEKSTLTKQIENINSEMTELRDKEVNIRLSLVRINEFNEKLEDLRESIEGIMWIRNSTDIKTGIPLIMVGNYLNPIKDKTNELLSLIYDDKFFIDFELSDTDFNIPVYKDGIYSAKDILMASQGETSNAKISLSMAVVHRIFELSNSTYNLVYLDELDGELDDDARESFLTLINRQMDMLHCEQCFVITHNKFFDSASAGLILLGGHKVDTEDDMFMHNKDIIFQIDK